jgi:chemotaxis protein histidine kinase CheA
MSKAQFIPAPMGLNRRFGAAASALRAPEGLRAAEQEVARLEPEMVEAIRASLTEIEDLARRRPAGVSPALYERAHMVRGIAGTFGLVDLGRTANQLCRYLEDAGPDHVPDANLVTSIVVTALQAVHRPVSDRETMEMLIEACREAVDTLLAREGRPAV